MKAQTKARLSFFEAVYMWIYIVMLNGKVFKVHGDFESSVTAVLFGIQISNVFVVYYIARKIFPAVQEFKFKSEGHWGINAWIVVGSFILLYILNARLLERRLDHIAEVHNALAQRQRDRNKTIMWVYVVGSILLFVAVLLVQEFVYNG